MKALCVVVHDVAPATWSASRRLLDAIADVGRFPVTLLAVPHYHGQARDEDFERWLLERERAGDEIALHGYRHLDDGKPRGWIDRQMRRTYTRGEGEFADLSFDEAMRRIDAGLAWLHELGVRPAGFVAPAWLLGADAWRALRSHRFAYTCTLRRIHLLRGCAEDGNERHIVCQSQVYSSASAWRRAASVVWNESLAQLQRNQAIVRLELHPADVDHTTLKSSWQRLARTQARTRTACTLQELVSAIQPA